MFPRVNNLIASAFAILLSCSLASAQPAHAPKVIIDTDFNTIFDDGQAVVMAAQLHSQGVINLLGLTVAAENENANAVEATNTANHGSDAVLDWNNTALTAIETLDLLPPIAGYCMAMAHAAIFDAVNSIIGDYQPYVTKVSAPPGASAAAAAAQAGHDVLVAVMPPAVKPQLDSALQASLAQLRMTNIHKTA